MGLLKTKMTCERDELEGLRGRLCYGGQPSDFNTLGYPAAKLCFLMGAQGLHIILQHNKDAEDGKDAGKDSARRL